MNNTTVVQEKVVLKDGKDAYLAGNVILSSRDGMVYGLNRKDNPLLFETMVADQEKIKNIIVFLTEARDVLGNLTEHYELYDKICDLVGDEQEVEDTFQRIKKVLDAGRDAS